MTTTRSGATTSAAPGDKANAGEKHKASNTSIPPAKSRKKDGEKQMTLEDTLSSKDGETSREDKDQETRGKEGAAEQQETSKSTDDTAVEPHGRNGTTPSSILEKGVVYFFFRGRVNTDEPKGLEDIARSYIILRPIPKDAQLGTGPIGDSSNSRLCVLPKKTLPQTGRDRWIAFVEKGGTSFDALKETFLASEEYETKTAGTRHKPAATPAGEGVYAITSTGRENHLAYMITLPENLGEVQNELGLKKQGSFIISTRNPKYPPPKYARLPEGPEYSQEILEGFRDLRWIGTVPAHLDVPNTQFLLIGESSGVKKAMQPEEADQKSGKAKPIEEMEKLEHEDTVRMNHLGKGDAGAIFADLEAQARNYPKLQTTF